MRRRIIVGILLLLLLGSLWMPFYSVYPHMNLSPDVGAAFPTAISGLQVIGQGSGTLPVSLMQSLAIIDFRGGLLAIGIALVLAGGILTLFHRRGISHLAALLGGAGMVLLFLFAFYAQQLDKSLLFDVMLTAQWFVWAVFVLSLALFAYEMWLIKSVKPLPLSDKGWRAVSAALCALSLLMLLLPFVSVSVPQGTFATPKDDALASRSITGWQWISGKEPLLSELASQNQAFSDPAGGGMASLTTLSDSAKNLKNLFMIPTYGGGDRTLFIAACGLMFLGFLLQLYRKADRWIPTCLIALSAVLLLSDAVGALVIDGRYQFMGAAYQLMFMGLGGYTPAPLFLAAASGAAALAAIMGIRRANEPYFINPVPEKKRILAVTICLCAVTVALLLLPVFQVSLYTPGKAQNNPTAVRQISGLELITFQKPQDLMSPANSRGKALYGTEPTKNGLTAESFQALLGGALNKMGAVTLGALTLSLTGLLLLFGVWRNKKAILAVLLTGGAAQALAVLLTFGLLPAEVGYVSPLGPLYISMGTTAFACFFTGFIDRQYLPKKYKLFLMMLPFLVAVFLFAYLPLYGWSYAFYNYKFELGPGQQEFVGFKWFTELVANAGHRSNIVRVMTNTFSMSGLGILTSWMPMAFAILLNEVSRTRFKKFVQIFTTLPNFISWTLVFSFGLAMFAMDTGIFSRFMLGIGAIDKPVAWLNSSEHIWIKMWGWSVWKGLGWGAIMYLAAIAGIDQELYEAAKVDGAGRWRQICHITLPGLLPTFFVLLLLSISNIINNGMDQYLVFQNSMNKDTIEVLDLYIYNITIASTSSNMYSFGTAIGVLKTLFSVMLLFAANFASKMLRGEPIV